MPAKYATAVALLKMQATPLALKNEQRCYEILKDLYGEEDTRTQDSASWLQVP
jgi:hypothetical protein